MQNARQKIIPIAVLSLGMGLFLICLVYLRNFELAWGVFLGNILAAANYVFLTKIVVKMLNKDYKGPAVLVGLFLAKLVLIAAVLTLAFWVVKVDVVGFVLGFGALIPVVLLAGLNFRRVL